MENMVFLIDVPRLPKGQRATAEDMTFFATELIYFLEAMGLEQTIIDSMYNFDFTKTKDLAFVHNIGGAHSGKLQQRTGYCGLGRAVKELGLATDQPLQIDFVTSSVGSLNDDFLSMIYLAAQGDDGLTEYNWRNPPIALKKKTTPQEAFQAKDGSRERLRSHVRQNFRVYYPTHESVKSSIAGSAGTIWFQSKWYNSPTFPREILRDCKSVRPGMLMHNKVWFRCSSSHDWNGLIPLGTVCTSGRRPIQVLELRRVSQLLGERMGQALQGSRDKGAQTQLSQLGVWCACTSASEYV